MSGAGSPTSTILPLSLLECRPCLPLSTLAGRPWILRARGRVCFPATFSQNSESLFRRVCHRHFRISFINYKECECRFKSVSLSEIEKPLQKTLLQPVVADSNCFYPKTSLSSLTIYDFLCRSFHLFTSNASIGKRDLHMWFLTLHKEVDAIVPYSFSLLITTSPLNSNLLLLLFWNLKVLRGVLAKGSARAVRAKCRWSSSAFTIIVTSR